MSVLSRQLGEQGRLYVDGQITDRIWRGGPHYKVALPRHNG